jgi:hypothetical protein
MLTGETARRLRLRRGHHRIIPVLVHCLGGRVSEVEIAAPPRLAGKSHYGLGRTLDVTLDLLYLAAIARPMDRPLYAWGRLGAAASLAGVLSLFYAAYASTAQGDGAHAGWLLLGAALLVLSVSLVLGGVVFERLSENENAEPGRAGERIE